MLYFKNTLNFMLKILNTINNMDHKGRSYATDALSLHCQYFKPVTLPHTRIYAQTHTHLHFSYTMQISQTQINNARAVITPRSTVT